MPTKEEEDIEDEPLDEVIDRDEDEGNENVVKPRVKVTSKFKPFIVGVKHFHKSEAAGKLHKALKGSKVDQDAITEVLASHNAQQRQAISKAYHTKYKKILLRDLKEKLSCNYERVCVGLLTPPSEFGVYNLRSMVEGSCKVNDIVGVLAWRDKLELAQIKKIYKEKFNAELMDDLLEECDKKYDIVIRILCAEDREDHTDDTQTEEDVNDLIAAAGSGKEAFRNNLYRILSSRSWQSLPDFIDLFEDVNNGKDICAVTQDTLEKRVAKALKPLFFVLDEPSAFYSEEIFDATDGPGTKDEKLIRLLIMRAEVDLKSIDVMYKDMFGQSLEKVIKEECGGHYKKILLRMAGVKPNKE